MSKKESKNPITESKDKNTEATTNNAAVPDADSLEQQLEQARLEANENLDKFLRAKAETENIRRRSAEEVTKARKFAVEQFAAELLVVRDSLELASKFSIEGEDSPDLTHMHEGVTLTLRQLDSVFEKESIVVIDPTGEKFDPELHQAMSMIDTDEVAPDHVVSVMQKGYLISDRLLRPAMVVVARSTTTPAQEKEKTDGAEA